MNNTKNTIEDLILFQSKFFSDIRGKLLKPIDLKKLNFDFNMKETWFTFSHKNVIRGMHLQINPYPTNKIVSVIQGSVLDVVLDCRKNSKTYGKFVSNYLNSKNNNVLYVPTGCAHGYKVLENNTVTLYASDNIHHAASDIGFNYNSFGFDWQIKNPIISSKDLNLPSFNEK